MTAWPVKFYYMYMGRRQAKVRWFLIGDQRWRAVTLQYVHALVNLGIEPLLLATPFVTLDRDDPFYAYRNLFFRQLAPDYVNVVFGLAHLQEGNILTGLKRMQALTDEKRGMPTDTSDLEEPAQPDHVRLWTQGVRNVAMVGSWPRPLTRDESVALQKYERVYVTGPSQWDAFGGEIGDKQLLIADPPTFARGLSALIEGIE